MGGASGSNSVAVAAQAEPDEARKKTLIETTIKIEIKKNNK